MSFDPNFQNEPPTPPLGQPPADGLATPAFGPASTIRQKVTIPAVLLLVSAILNLLFAAYFVANLLLSPPPEVQREMMKKHPMFQSPEMIKALEDAEKQGWTPEKMAEVGQYTNSTLIATNVLIALLGILAGIRMLQLRSYGLAVLASLLTSIPLISGSSCCCIGEVAGVYALIVLLRTDVRDAFRSAPLTPPPRGG